MKTEVMNETRTHRLEAGQWINKTAKPTQPPVAKSKPSPPAQGEQLAQSKPSQPGRSLTLDGSAEALAVRPIDVLRLFGLGRLHGRRTPAGEWMFDEASVANLTAHDLKAPATPGAMGYGRGWFDEPDAEHAAREFESKIRDYLESQCPDDKTALRLVNEMREPSVSIDAKVTPELMALLNAPLAAAGRFGTGKNLLLAMNLRNQAQLAVTASNKLGERPLATFYSEGLTKFVQTAAANLLTRELCGRTAYMLEPEFARIPVRCQVTTRLKLSQITTAAELTGSVAALAF